MNILRKLTVAQIRGGKSRFAVTVVGVMLSAAMVAAVLLGCDSVMDAMRRGVIDQSGDYHWQGAGRIETVRQLADNELFGRFGYAQALPYTGGGSLAEPLACTAVGGDAWQMLGARVVAGELPDAPGEAAVLDALAASAQLAPGSTLTVVDPADGSAIPLTVTAVLDRFSIDRTLPADQRQPVYLAADGIGVPGLPEEYDRVHFWAGARQLDNGFFAGVAALQQQLPTTDPTFSGWLNYTLLTWSGVRVPGSSDNLLDLVTALRAFLLALISVCAALMVSNAFSLSLAERRRTLGLLASAGATPAQRAGVILYEALAAGLIGIPAGLLLACGGLAVAFRALDPLFAVLSRRYLGMDLRLSLAADPDWLILSGAASAAVLLLSAWRPALHAGRAGPIDAIRGEGEIRLNARALKGGRLFGRVFGPEGMLARKNARRSVHRYRATLLSLTLSVILLVTASAFAQYLETAYSMGHRDAGYNVTAAMDCYSTAGDGGAHPLRQALLSPAHAQSVRELEHIQWGMLTLPADRIGAQTARLGWQYAADTGLNDPASCWAAAGEGSAALAMQPYLLVLPDEEYAALAGQDAAADGRTIDCVVIDRCYMPGADGGMVEVSPQMALRPGDTMEWDFNTLPVTLRVAAVADDPPRDLVQTWPSPYIMTLVTSRSAADAVFARFTAELGSYCPRYFDFYYQSADPAALYAELTALYDSQTLPNVSLTVTDLQSNQETVHSLTMLVRVALYGFVALISLICAANIANTVSSGTALRRRETALLCANGLTSGGLRRMLFLESAIYSIQALVIGLPASAALAWLVWRRVVRLYYFRFTLPWGAMAAAVAGALGVSLLAALPALLHAARHPPAEDFRAEE